MCTATSRNLPDAEVRAIALPSLPIARQIPFPEPHVKIGFHRGPLLHTLGVCRHAARRLPSVANAQNPDEKGWVSREGSL